MNGELDIQYILVHTTAFASYRYFSEHICNDGIGLICSILQLLSIRCVGGGLFASMHFFFFYDLFMLILLFYGCCGVV